MGLWDQAFLIICSFVDVKKGRRSKALPTEYTEKGRKKGLKVKSEKAKNRNNIFAFGERSRAKRQKAKRQRRKGE